MKRVSTILCVLLATVFLFIPASAKDRNDLQKIYDDLSQYLYTPYFDHSEYFSKYQDELSKTKELLDLKNASSSEINLQYTAVRNAYKNLAKDVFDYSSLDILVENFHLLNLSLFEESSWDSFYNLMEEIFNEVDCPTLFKKGTATEEEYAKTVNEYIANFSTQFYDLYNNLKLKDISDGLTKEELISLANYCSLSVREEFMGETPYWPNFLDAQEDVAECTAKNNPTKNQINQATERLLSAYNRLCADVFDSSPMQDELARFERLSAANFTEASWNRYALCIEKLKISADTPVFLYLDSTINFDEFKEKTHHYFITMAEPAKVAYSNLITKEKHNELFTLCSTYAGVKSTKGVEVKWKVLQSSIADAQEILGNNEATLEEYDTAIQSIKNAAENLIAAQNFLAEEQKGLVVQDIDTLQSIILSLVISLLLSAALACFVSYRQNGRINWKK